MQARRRRGGGGDRRTTARRAAAWEALARGGSPCAGALEPELRRGAHAALSWLLLLRFSPGSPFAHISEWRPLAERIVARLEQAGLEARWRGGRSDVIEIYPPQRPTGS